ncbi:MAG: hypothetical protein KAT28_00810 [Candidatus Aenigmarchaeota archaeon]|nr:hypothetical protein [Candidatus Aenigmarchaeota archaeon]
MGIMDHGYPGLNKKDDISGNGLPDESTGELTKYRKPPVVNMLDELSGNRPPYKAIGAY